MGAQTKKCKYIYSKILKYIEFMFLFCFRKSENLESHFPGVFLSPNFIVTLQKMMIFFWSYQHLIKKVTR